MPIFGTIKGSILLNLLIRCFLAGIILMMVKLCMFFGVLVCV